MKIIPLRQADLGEGFQVARALPTKDQRMVGPWCFLDRIGPVALTGGAGMHVAAHPHTCLQTFTWVMEGSILHRDSLGTEQVIHPGQVNLMTAGHGISHTEDTLPGTGNLHAAQLWIALPPEHADMPPRFDHYPRLAQWHQGRQGHLRVTLLAGRFGSEQAPTYVLSPLVGMDITAQDTDDDTLALNPLFEYGVLPLAGDIQVNDAMVSTDQFAYLPAGSQKLTLSLQRKARCLIIGGEPFPNPISMWWNFVGHTRAAVEQAQADWVAHHERFGSVPRAQHRLQAPPIPWIHR